MTKLTTKIILKKYNPSRSLSLFFLNITNLVFLNYYQEKNCYKKETNPRN